MPDMLSTMEWYALLLSGVPNGRNFCTHTRSHSEQKLIACIATTHTYSYLLNGVVALLFLSEGPEAESLPALAARCGLPSVAELQRLAGNSLDTVKGGTGSLPASIVVRAQPRPLEAARVASSSSPIAPRDWCLGGNTA